MTEAPDDQAATFVYVDAAQRVPRVRLLVGARVFFVRLNPTIGDRDGHLNGARSEH